MGYVTVQEGYKRTLIIPVETFLSASQTADINEYVSYFIASLLVSAAPYDSAGKTQSGSLSSVWRSYRQVVGVFQGPAKSPKTQGATLVPTLSPSIIPLATASRLHWACPGASQLEEKVRGGGCGCHFRAL